MANQCGLSHGCSTCHCDPCKCRDGNSCSDKNNYWKQKIEKKIEFCKMMLSAMDEKDAEKRHEKMKDVMEKKIEYYESCLKKCD